MSKDVQTGACFMEIVTVVKFLDIVPSSPSKMCVESDVYSLLSTLLYRYGREFFQHAIIIIRSALSQFCSIAVCSICVKEAHMNWMQQAQ